jgi:hypothetical protein
VDARSSRELVGAFNQAVEHSERCAATSWKMAEDYEEWYDVPTIPILPGIDHSMAQRPARELTSSATFTIALAGQIYAVREWEALLAALDLCNWNILGRSVVVKLLGQSAPALSTRRPLHVEFLGWRSQEDSIRSLSGIDLLYCPYWFDPEYEVACRHSFPSKLTTYLASGRPVLFHGPEYASPATFLKMTNGGLCCHSLDPTMILACLEQLVRDKQLYAILAENGRYAFDTHLTRRQLRRDFAYFLSVEEDQLQEVG